jgi:hypothetical protein
MKPALRSLDFLLILIAAALCLGAAYWAYRPENGVAQVNVKGEGGQAWVYPLKGTTETIDVKGPLGITVVRIAGGAAWIEASPCKNKTCISAGKLSKPGDWTACLPNKVFVRIDGNDENNEAPDAVVW